MTDALTTLEEIRGRVGRNEREHYDWALLMGDIVEPRAGTPVGHRGPGFMGGVALGPVAQRGRFFVREIRFVEPGRILALAPRFATRAEAETFGRKLAFRAGARIGHLADEQAMLSLDAHLWGTDAAWPRPSVTSDAIREALRDYLDGHGIDESRLYGTESPFEDVLLCGDGSVWQRIRTLSGAVSVTFECIDMTARDFDYEAAHSDDGRPDAAFYVLRTGEPGARYVAATVRIAPADWKQDPIVNGPFNKDPFPRFGAQIARLAESLGVEILPAHYAHGGVAVGDDEVRLAEGGFSNRG